MSLLTKIERPLKAFSNNTLSDAMNRCDRCGANAVGDATGCFKGLCPNCAEVAFRLEKRAELNVVSVTAVIIILNFFAIWLLIWRGLSQEGIVKFAVVAVELVLMHGLLQRGLKAVYKSIKEKRIKHLYIVMIALYLYFSLYYPKVLAYTAPLPLFVCVAMIILILIRLRQKEDALEDYRYENGKYVRNLENRTNKTQGEIAMSTVSLNPEKGTAEDKPGLGLDLMQLGQEDFKNGDN